MVKQAWPAGSSRANLLPVFARKKYLQGHWEKTQEKYLQGQWGKTNFSQANDCDLIVILVRACAVCGGVVPGQGIGSWCGCHRGLALPSAVRCAACTVSEVADVHHDVCMHACMCSGQGVGRGSAPKRLLLDGAGFFPEAF